LKADVEGHSAPAKKASIGSPASLGIKRTDSHLELYEDTDLTNIRKVIAERLTYSKQNVPHYYVTI
jgi:pyruvate dehydrogenase E2 component (dihydrolipoamide acetyltransferase)